VQRTLTHQLVESHLTAGKPVAGTEVALRIDQTLTQDATGTLVMLALEAMELERIATSVSAQYVDHNLVQSDHKNADDHLFLESACKRFGVRYSRPGNGVSHPLHMQSFGVPGATLLGSDSHTCAAGSLGMLAIGAGGLDVAMAMAGEPFYLEMPAVWGVRLNGELPDWVSAKDVILELLRRHGVSGGVGKVIEYYGPGVANLSAMDRHVIANMGAELGATTTVFPSDARTREFLKAHGREHDWRELRADEGADYDEREELDLSAIEPLIAKPSSPGNVVPVREVAGEPIHQAYIGSSANPGYRDFAIAAHMVSSARVAPGVSLDINPSSRLVLEQLIHSGRLSELVHAGARLHQAGCNGCIGMGQAPATDRNSLRTTPRNFPGRSGTKEDRVWLCSPETAVASAIRGEITDPRDLNVDVPKVETPPAVSMDQSLIAAPPAFERARRVRLVKGPNISPLPELDRLPDTLDVEVLLHMGDDVSTDEILPAGTRVLPLRSSVQAISKFAFEGIDPSYPERAHRCQLVWHAVVAGHNYGQGSSREHAALAPRYLGLRVVLAKSYARIHHENLVNFGVLPLEYDNPEDHDHISRGQKLHLASLGHALHALVADEVMHVQLDDDRRIAVRHSLSPRQVEIVRAGGKIRWAQKRRPGGTTAVDGAAPHPAE
jgi:aconitate hydratase